MDLRADTIADDLHPVLEVLARLPEVRALRPLEHGFSIEFAEADFVVTLSGLGTGRACETDWVVTVREPEPGLDTWWGAWHRSFAVQQHSAGPLIAGEVRDALARVRLMLADRARARQDA